jgi:hypothetical protein
MPSSNVSEPSMTHRSGVSMSQCFGERRRHTQNSANEPGHLAIDHGVRFHQLLSSRTRYQSVRPEGRRDFAGSSGAKPPGT